MFKFIFAGVLCLISGNLFAQVGYSNFANEAVLFSQTGVNGTARFIGLGGANTSLGADISSISGNPAGLGFYNRSAWAVSPVLRLGNFNADYNILTGRAPNTFDINSQRSFGANVQIPNAGVVFNNRFDEGSGWISGTFGMGYNQKRSFYNDINYSGNVGIVDGLYNDFVEYAALPFLDNSSPSGFREFQTEDQALDAIFADTYSELAYNTFLLDVVNDVDNGIFFVDRYDFDEEQGVGYLTTNSFQTENIRTRGGLSTLDLSYGANYQDKLYLGAALNINFLNYEQERIFTERPDNLLISNIELIDFRTLSGAGAGVTVGAIFKPISAVNLGVSYSSPSFIAINETQSIELITNGVTGNNSAEIINEVPAYNFIIPQKVSAGASVFLGKYGFITADVEYIDYANAQYGTTQNAFGNLAPEIGEELNSTYNIKVGAEGRLGAFRLRAGYNYMDNPYRAQGVSNPAFTQGRSVISGGLGIQKKGFFFDATYSLISQNNPLVQPYNFGDIAPGFVESTSQISTIRLTVGKSF